MPSALPQLTAALADRYAIEREIGRGGMATVYLARDLKHDRRVALKVLDPELGAVLGVDRFLSEIRVTANLQHPNLLPLFDSGEAAGLLYYVMPFVDGESLRAKLDRDKQLPIDDAVRIAVAIANALEYAHGHGVVHRDLKPENVLLQAGQPVVADFGIALAVSNAGGARVTQTGISLGTPAYMSPEQAMGDRAIDRRSDVYALGAMTYEMLVGEPPHTGSTAQAIVARLITERPRPIRASRPSVPESVDAAIQRALEKLPADRWQSAAEFGEALRGGHDRMSAYRGSVSGIWGPGRRRAAAGAVILGAAVLGAAIWSLVRPSPDSPPTPVRFELTLPTSLELVGGVGQALVLTADGQTLVYRGSSLEGGLMYQRALGDLMPKSIQGTAGALHLFGSPDGRWAGFVVRDTLWRVGLSGGVPEKVAPDANGLGASWGAKGQIVVGARPGASGLAQVSAAGGVLVPLSRPDSANAELDHRWPFVLPDGETVLFTSWSGTSTSARIGMVSIGTGRDTVFEIAGSHVLGFIDGYAIYARPDADQYSSGAILAVPIDVRRRRVSGAPVVLLTDVAMGIRGPAKAALSSAGTLVYQRGALQRRLMLVDSLRRSREVLLGSEPVAAPRFSPDGKRIAFAAGITAGGKPDIFIADLGSGTKLRLTSEASYADEPEWTADGSRVVYRTVAGATSTVRWQAADGSGKSEVLLTTPWGRGARERLNEVFLTPDGRMLVYVISSATGSEDIWYRSLSGDTVARPIAMSGFNERTPAMSPDGRWIAYASDASGSSEVYVQPFPGLGARHPVSIGGGAEPRWLPDGRHIYFRNGRRIMAARVTTSPGFAVLRRDTVVSIEPLTWAAGRNFDVANDGRILYLSERLTSSPLMVVLNWLTEIRATLAAPR